MTPESDREALYAQLEIIGTTVPVDEERLPQRLSPVYRRVGDPEVILVPVEEGGPELPQLCEEDLDWVREQEEGGGFQHIDPPISARPDHLLMQFEPDRAPELIHVARLDERLAETYQDALRRAEQALTRGDRAEALRLASRAVRSVRPWEPIPRLLQLALARQSVPGREIPPRHITRLEEGIQVISQSKLWEAWSKLSSDALPSVQELIKQELEHWHPGFSTPPVPVKPAVQEASLKRKPAYL